MELYEGGWKVIQSTLLVGLIHIMKPDQNNHPSGFYLFELLSFVSGEDDGLDVFLDLGDGNIQLVGDRHLTVRNRACGFLELNEYNITKSYLI